MTAAEIIRALNIAAIILGVMGAAICFWYAWRFKNNDDALFRVFAGIILLYFSLTYLLALYVPTGESFGVWYLVKSGVMTRAGVIALILLLITWVFVDAGKCRRE